MPESAVITLSGPVSGAIQDGVAVFRSVPYAAAPVGDLRFALPEAHAPWTEVREAVEPGPTSPQTVRQLGNLDAEPLVGKGWTKGDDFLALNIWAPTDAHDAPVMVFIHGGAFVVGGADTSVQDGSAFARDGVVCVAINYRLGVEGFLPIPGAPENLGLHDQIAALRWVKENIAAFGGDPANVTAFGESAGAMSLADLLASPLAQGLFRRAIVQSGHGAMTRSIPVTQRLVRKLAKLLGVPATLEGFRSKTQAECLTALETVSQPMTRIDLRDERGYEPAFGLSRFLPVHGDALLPQPPLDSLKDGVGAEVDLLIGTNTEEMNIYLVPTGVRKSIGGWLSTLLLGRSIRQARAILEDYGAKQKGRKAGDALSDAMTDLVFRAPARRFAAAHQGRTHVYEFDWRSPAFGGELGACHGLELPFVFDTLATCTGPQGLAGTAPPQALADRVHRLWVDFARDGTAPWPEYDGETRQVYSLAQGRAASEPRMAADRYLP